MDVPPGSVIITPTALYEKVEAIGQDVSGMRGDLREISSSISKALPDHESRIRALEKKVWWASGLSAGAAAAISQVLHALGKV